MTSMSRRAAALLVAFGLLVAAGSALRMPCCGLAQLTRVSALEAPDCCPTPDCCRGEKRGPAQAALTSRAPDTGLRPALALQQMPAHPAPIGFFLTRFRAPFAFTEHSPPAERPNPRLLISLIRV